MSKFTEGTESTYAELPTAANYLYWKRGNGQLEHLKDSDSGEKMNGLHMTGTSQSMNHIA